MTWYNGSARPPETILAQANRKLTEKGNKFNPVTDLNDQGSIYIGEKGVMYSPYVATPVLLPASDFKDFKMPAVKGDNHYLQFVEAVRGNDKTSAPFSYSGPLTEMVLLGCLATRFEKTDLKWDTKGLKFSNNTKANEFVKKTYRKGFEVEGL